MQVNQFTIKDLDMMNSWYRSRNMPEIPAEALPKIGFIVEGKACGFLYQADGGISIIEGYITPENLHYQERSDAIDAVTEALLSAAKEQGSKKIMVLTQAQAIYDRSLKFGFRDMGSYQVLSKDLQAESNKV